jgi:ComF family protein
MSLIIDLLFPKTCFGCGQVGQYFCPKCQEKIKYHLVKYSSHPPKEGRLSLFCFHGSIRRAIQSLKYEFTTDIIDEMSTIFTQKLQHTYPHLIKYWQQNNFVLTPIPLHWSRQNWRGFNQSSLLGQSISQKLNLKFSDQIILRIKSTNSQAKIKSHQQRLKNIHQAFTPILPIPKNLIIFDDVATSFSTLNSALSSLTSCGLNRCWYLTLAG